MAENLRSGRREAAFLLAAPVPPVGGRVLSTAAGGSLSEGVLKHELVTVRRENVRMAVAAEATKAAVPEIIEAGCKMLAASAKSGIGTYKFGWPALGPEAVATHGDTPLLDTGELQSSIEWNASGNEGFVGTNDPKAAWQEFGTSRIPPRPFLGGAVQHEAGEIEAIAAKVMTVAIGGGSELAEILRLAKHAAEQAVEMGRDTVNAGDQ
jgi:HK97 gp10 family phage protein